uniref:Uncharacterized protein n=1 Tax=Pavo cristatus TaxID=9049 RepID=A0A8C9FKQ9_PAVCR
SRTNRTKLIGKREMTNTSHSSEFRLRAWRSEIRSVDSSCCLLQSQHPIQSLQPPANFLPSPDKFSSSFPRIINPNEPNLVKIKQIFSKFSKGTSPQLIGLNVSLFS